MPESTDIPDHADLLAEQLRIKEAIIDGISDALMLLDAKTFEILEVNSAFLASYGLTREQVVRSHSSCIFSVQSS